MEAASSNAALMRRIVQLESERDDLRRDVETLCMQQSGKQSLTSSLMGPLQARRLAGLEQDLESCRQKSSMYQRENTNLQDELSEIYHIKSQVSDLYKTESEKNKKLEEELKFFQSKASTLMNERDKLLLEMERIRRNEQNLQGELRDCQRLNKHIVQESENIKDNVIQLQSEIDIYYQVIKRFWQFRGSEDSPSCSEMARGLLSDPEESWTFGNYKHFEQKAESLQTTIAEMGKELTASKADSARLLQQLSNEVRSNEESTIRARSFEEKQLECERTLRSTAQELTNLHKSLKEDIRSTLLSEMTFFEAAVSSFEDYMIKHKPEEPSLSVTGSRVISDTSDTATSSEVSRGAQRTVSQEAFLQALHEKVAALMLLSQEEERHHLEVVTTGALEYQLKELNQKLSQVTLEKVEALMEVAQLKYNIQEVRDRERELLRLLEKPSVGGRLLPASWAGQAEPLVAGTVDNKQSRKPSSTGGYLKSWLRGGDLYGFISNQSETKASQTEADKATDWARSRVENAALHERMTSLQQLIKTAKRLQATLAGADGSRDSESVMSSLSVVNGAVEEAQRLKAAVSCCNASSNLPVSWSGGESGRAGAGGRVEGMDDRDRAVVELVSAAGLALVELLLATADLQRQFLTARLTK